jgi:MFS transporter, DHA1 family, tetracycline resistance protein
MGSLVLLRSHPELFGLAMVNFLYNLAHVVLPSVAVLYMGYRYGWDAKAVGFVLAGVGLCAMVVQAGLVGWSVAKFGERRTLLAGLVFGAAGFALYGLAASGTVFLVGVPLMSLWGLAGSALQGLMSRRVNEYEQGQLQGANSSLQGIANLVGPFLFTLTFAYSINPAHPIHIPGTPFLLAASLLVIALWLAWSITRAR